MKTILIGILFFTCRSVMGQQQEEIALPKFLFKVSPQQFAINTLKIGAEIFNANQTKSVNFFLYGRFDNNNNNGYGSYYGSDNQSKGFGGEVQFRKYINPFKNYTTKRGRTFLQGIYVSAYVQSSSYKQDYQYQSYNYNTGGSPTLIQVKESTLNIGSGFTIGVHRTLWKALFIDAYIGGGMQFANYDRSITPPDPNEYFYNYSSITDPEYEGILPKFGLMIGVEF